MYSRRVIAEAIEERNQRRVARGLRPLERYSRADIDYMIRHLHEAWDPDEKVMTRPLTLPEIEFIRNEREMCAIDFRDHWLPNYCNPPEAPIWMADHTFKAIGDIRVGDVVVGWQKADRPKFAKQFVRDHYRPSKVIAISRRIAPLVEVKLASGRTIRCTHDHLWSNGSSARTGMSGNGRSTKRQPNHRLWTRAQVGRQLRFALDPISRDSLSEEEKDLASWLGGIYDGEGSFKTSLVIAQSRTANPEVYAAIGNALTRLGFTFSSDDRLYRLTGGFRAIARFYILCRPVRSERMRAYLFGQTLTQRDRIVSVTPIGDGEVVSLRTETGNYVAWGYLSKNCYIVNWQKTPQRFTPNVAQQVIMDLWAEREDQGLAIWMQQLKARRLGVSTLSELVVCHRFQFHPHSNCVVASADPTKTVEMAGMIKYAIDQQPWWLIPEGEPKISRGIPIEFPDIHTALTFQAGNQFTGVARGSTPNIVHLSELMEWRDAGDLIDGALMRAIVDSPKVFGILESTGGNLGGWWHRTWEQNKRDWGRGRARMIPVFLPWYVGTDLYPSAADLRARPVPENWTPSDRSIAHAERAREYVMSNQLLFRHLAHGDRNWQLTREQMWFREIEYETAKEKKQLHIFHQELAADDFEAFQSSNTPVIDPEILMSYQENTRHPEGVYTVIGPDIPEMLVAPTRYWDGSKPTIIASTKNILSNYDVKYQFVPIQFEGYSSLDENLKLLLYEMPTDGHTYGIGADPADGMGLDNSVIAVLREALPMRPPGLVAEWASNQVTAVQMWPLVMAVGSLFATFNVRANRVTQPLVCVETWSNGTTIQNEMQKRGWSNFHSWRYAGDRKKPQTQATANKIGVYTNQWFRSGMMDMLLTCLTEEAIEIPSPYLVQELISLERAPGQSKIEAAPDAHDDRVMAFGIPLFCMHMDKPPARQYQRRRVNYAAGMPSEDGVVHPTYQPPAQASSDLIRGVQLPFVSDHRGGRFERYKNPNVPIRYR